MEFEKISESEWKKKVSEQLKSSSVEIFSSEIENGFTVPSYSTAQHINSKASFPTEPKWVENIQTASGFGDILIGNIKDFQNSSQTKGIVVSSSLSEIKDIEKKLPLNSFQYWWNVFEEFETQENFEINWEEINKPFGELEPFLQSKIYFLIDVSLHQNAGANYTDQLSIVLAKMIELASHFPITILENCVVKMAIGGNYLVEISKLRALHWLLENFCAAFAQNAEKIKIATIPTLLNKTIQDPENNLIRSTLEISVGILGGAHFLEFIPFSNQENPKWVEEVSVKQALILSHESLLNFYNDALAGSYTVENLSFELANNAWKKFQYIEKQGGYVKEFPKILSKIQTSLEEYISSINEQTTKIIGYNLYESKEFKPLENPKKLSVLAPYTLP